MGYSHIILPENQRISYYLTHPQERKATIKTFLTAIRVGIQDGKFKEGVLATQLPEDIIDLLMKELRDYPRSFEVDKAGNVTTRPIPVPEIKEAIEEVSS